MIRTATAGIQVGDGVDPNRNYREHWNYDGEGSSSAIRRATYRGPSGGSEPETQAIEGLFNRIDFKLQANYHSFGPWLLYPQGWQIGTPTGDDPIFYALAGNRDNPAIPGFVPGLSSDVLYVTNGEMTDFAYSRRGTISYTPELNEGCTGCGFVFPDNEALVQAEFQKTLAFNLDLAKSAGDPAHPTSHLGITTKPFYLKSDDTYKFGLPEANFTFRLLLRRPAAGPGARTSEPGCGDRKVEGERRGDPERHDLGVGRRRQVRREHEPLVPRHAGSCHRDEPG